MKCHVAILRVRAALVCQIAVIRTGGGINPRNAVDAGLTRTIPYLGFR